MPRSGIARAAAGTLGLLLAAQAVRAGEGPVLSMMVGEFDHAGKASQCLLYPNHPELKGRQLQLEGWILAAARAAVSEAKHVGVTVPSVEFDAYAREPGRKGKLVRKKVVLSVDHRSLKRRQGPEAEELIALTKRLCAENR